MKKFLLLTLTLSVLLACNQEPQVTYAVISGSIENPVGDNVVIYKNNKKVLEIPLDEQGKFSDTLTNANGYYALSQGRERSTVYFSGGDNLTVSLDTKEFDESISFEGVGAERNNYLAKKYLTDEELSGSYADFFSLEEDAFMEKLNGLNDAKVILLNETDGLDKTFTELERKNLKFEHLTNINSYPSAHSYYAKKQDFKPSESFMNPVENVDFYDSDMYAQIDNYKSLVQSYLSAKVANSDNPADVFSEIQSNGSKALQEDLAKRLNYSVGPTNEHNKAYVDAILAMSTDDDLKTKLKAKYDKVKNLAKGMPSPQFSDYENHKGGTTSLEDLKGNYVYIDIWATWCAPCIREIPSLKKLEAEYHDKKITFVSVSVDRGSDHEKWTKMVNEKELGGVQLFADRNYKGGAIADIGTEFIRNYAIEGIPRFILIDPDGNIVSADAPRPSNPKLKKLFEELLSI